MAEHTCPVKDRETGAPCHYTLVLGKAPSKKVAGVRGVETCDFHGAPFIGKSAWRARRLVRGYLRTQDDLDWSPLDEDSRKSVGLFRHWWRRVAEDPSSVAGFLRVADKVASQITYDARMFLIESRIREAQSVMARPSVEISIDTDDPVQVRRLERKQKGLNRIRSRIEFALQQMARNHSRLPPQGDLSGKEKWNVLRDTALTAIDIHPWVLAYAEGRTQADVHLQRKAELAAKDTAGDKDVETGEDQAVDTANGGEAAGVTAEEEPEAEVKGKTALGTPPIDAISVLPDSERTIRAWKTECPSAEKEQARARALVETHGGCIWITASLKAQLEAAARDNGSSIRVTERRRR